MLRYDTLEMFLISRNYPKTIKWKPQETTTLIQSSLADMLADSTELRYMASGCLSQALLNLSS